MSRSYERLPIEEFGKHLISSMDLDPVYVALRNTQMNDKQRKRWLIAYWCFYDVGAACWLSHASGKGFWDSLSVAASNKTPTAFGGRWPRGSERRHFRGEASERAVAKLRERYPEPESFVGYLSTLPHPVGDNSFTCGQVMERVMEHHLFGPWIAFKVADMLERVLGVTVSFSQAEVLMFDQPKESALMLWRERVAKTVPKDMKVVPKDEATAIRAVVAYLLDTFRTFDAPPGNSRKIGLQEVETILCKWKSHMNGHYPLWHDVDEINAGLVPWLAHSELAQRFNEAMPKKAP